MGIIENQKKILNEMQTGFISDVYLENYEYVSFGVKGVGFKVLGSEFRFVAKPKHASKLGFRV